MFRSVKHILCLITLLTPGLPSFCGPPFGTDDPQPVDFRHWEYYLSSMNQFQHNFSTGTLPHFEVNYGLIRNCQIHFELPMNYNSFPSKEFQYGYGNTEVGIKIRLFKNSDESFQVGIFPIAEIPTVKNPYFTNNKTQLYLPLWVQKSWGKFTTYGGGGYWINPGGTNVNWFFSGWEAQYDISRHFTLGGELYYKTAPEKDAKQALGFNLGGFINFTEKVHFIFSAGHSLSGEPTTTTYAGLLITI